MKTKNNILVALDLEEQAMIALQYAEHYAEMLDYELEVVTVVEETGLFGKLFSQAEIEKKVKENIEERVEKAVAPYSGKVKINTHIAYGKPYEKIVELANKIKPSIIFMGKSEMPKYKQAFLGSNSLHVILESDFPVITIRGAHDFEKYKNEHREILVPLDLRKGVSEQVCAAIEFAKLLKTSMYLFSIERSGSKGEETKMLSQLAQAKKVAIDAGIECRSELVQNKDEEVYKLICNEAKKTKAALIVIMTREENKFTDLFMGSNARNIINNSDVPVLSIEPWDKKAGSDIFEQYIDIFNVYK